MRAFSLILATTTALSLTIAAHAATPATPKATTAAEAKTDAAPAKDYTILKLNNQDIKNSEVEELWKGLFPAGPAPDFTTFDESTRQNVLRGVVSERLLYAEAIKAGTDKNAEVLKRLENLKKQLILQSFIEEKAKTLVTDEELKKAYDAKLAEMKGQEEVKARHILVKTEDEAKDIEKQLKKGGDFEKIAKEKSTDKGSGVNGGDLGYFTKDKMVPEFAEAAFKLKKGEVSAPIKTGFGWHIIKVEDKRAVTPPSFESMKDSLRAEAQNKAVQGYVEKLLKGADIKYYDVNGKEKPFPREFEAAKTPANAAAPAEKQ